MQNICIVINNVLSIVINIQNITIFEPVILTGFYTSKNIVEYPHVPSHFLLFLQCYHQNKLTPPSYDC